MASQTPRPRKAKNNGHINKPHDPLFVQGRTAGWQDVAPATQVHPKLGMETENRDATRIVAGLRKTVQRARQSTPDSKALDRIRKSRPLMITWTSYPT